LPWACAKFYYLLSFIINAARPEIEVKIYGENNKNSFLKRFR
jgi:hypothetical protein